MCFGFVAVAHVRWLYRHNHLYMNICHENIILCNIGYSSVIVPQTFPSGKHIVDVTIVLDHLDLVSCV